MTNKINAKAIKQEMKFSKKLDLYQVRRWLHDHSYELRVVVYAEQWATQTGRLSCEEETALRNMSPAQYIEAAVKVVNSIDYYSTVNALKAWGEAL